MRVLVSWLRDFVTFDATVQDLADVLTMRGFEVSAIEPVPPGVQSEAEDAVLDLEITTNRPDCLSVLGIAREVSTIYDADLRGPSLGTDRHPAGDETHTALSVTVEDPDLCPRYAAAVAVVTVGPSPAWLAARLEAGGVRPINNVVDITNYVMLELGHPMHAFDLEALSGRTLRVRRSVAGEKAHTLDGQERALRPDMLVIADSDRPQAVAGVMGGAESEVSGSTRVVALESAYFLPASVRRTSKQLALSTDASYRFERGADIEAPVLAIRRALTLLEQSGGGQARGPLIDAYPVPHVTTRITLRHARIGRILGVTVDASFVEKVLTRLGFTVLADRSDDRDERELCWQVTVPTHRVDVSREIDLIEEIARHYGYDRFPSTFPPAAEPPAPLSQWQRRQRLLRRILTAGGCSEAITYSFIERAAAAPFIGDVSKLVSMANPLSEKYTVLRPSLLPGLIDSLVRNRRREHRDVRLFEIGKRFHRDKGETAALAVAITGAGTPEHWSAADRGVDFFDLKGIIEQTCHALGVAPMFERTDVPFLVAGRAAIVHATAPDPARRAAIGYLGQLVPAWATARGLPGTGDDVYVAELDLTALEAVSSDQDTLHAAPVPRQPTVVRDLAVVVSHDLPAATVRDTILTVAPNTLVSVREFDRYAGAGVPDGCVSLALHLTFRAPDRTLTDAEVQLAIDTVVAALQEQVGAKLR